MHFVKEISISLPLKHSERKFKMIIGVIGSRGTVPTSTDATVSFLIDNRFLFECPSEIVQSFQRFQDNWTSSNEQMRSEVEALGRPSFGKITHIILSHLHFDHWGGLPHILHRILLLEKEKREKTPLILIIPKDSTTPFQIRMKHVFNSNLDAPILPDDEFLHRFLAIEIGGEITKILQIIVAEPEKEINLGYGYSLTSFENKHLNQGSMAFKLTLKKVKLNVKKAKKLQIPFNATLREIETGSSLVVVNNKEISREDIFNDIKIIVGYSGDSPIDSDVLEFLSESDLLIHETSYLDQNESYHLDLHSDLISLIESLQEFNKIKLLLPIHFSIRYKSEEITNTIEKINSPNLRILNPLDSHIFQIKPKVDPSRTIGE
jgi:ribonuclease BN (tRNA processing enzyme)